MERLRGRDKRQGQVLKLLACAVTFMIGVQAFTNMGVATGILPPKGTTLPFFSASGSSLLISLMAAGYCWGFQESFWRK